MRLICPECKNEINLSLYPDLAIDNIIECETCGITLSTTNIDDNGEVEVEVVDEGK